MNELLTGGMSAGFNGGLNRGLNLNGIWNLVKKNEVIVNITQTIGHCSVPLLVFLNSFDSTFIDITGKILSQQFLFYFYRGVSTSICRAINRAALNRAARFAF